VKRFDDETTCRMRRHCSCDDLKSVNARVDECAEIRNDKTVMVPSNSCASLVQKSCPGCTRSRSVRHHKGCPAAGARRSGPPGSHGSGRVSLQSGFGHAARLSGCPRRVHRAVDRLLMPISLPVFLSRSTTSTRGICLGPMQTAHQLSITSRRR
jgi:hypothetical protein